MSEKLKHYEDGFTTTVEKDGGREQEAVVNTAPAETHSPEILAKDVKEIVEEADRKQDQHLLDNYYDKDEMEELYYDKGEVNALLETKQDEIDGESVESGTVASMLGLDSEGNLVKGTVPSGSVVDSELDIDSTNPVENKAIAEAFENVVNGSTVVGKSLTAKQVENVSEESGSTQDEPFIFQATGTDDNTTETPTAPVAKHLELRGNSVAWNQLAKGLDSQGYTSNIGTLVANSSQKATITLTTDTGNSYSVLLRVQGGSIADTLKATPNHKYLIKFKLTSPKANGTTNRIYIGSDSYNAFYTIASGVNNVGAIIDFAGTQNATFSITVDLSLGNFAVGDEIVIENFIIVDLTLLGKEYDSVLAFNRDYPQPYYVYNAGELISCKCNKLITIGYNQFDGVLEQGAINSSGNNESNDSVIRAKNYIRVIPGQTYTFEIQASLFHSYCFIYCYDGAKNYIGSLSFFSQAGTSNQKELPNNACYVRFTLPSNSSVPATNECCVHLTWDESRTGYAEYDKHEYALPNVELRSAGNVYDEITPDGNYVKRIGFVNLGTLNWSVNSAENGRFIADYNSNQDIIGLIAIPSGLGAISNSICSKYQIKSWNNISANANGIAVYGGSSGGIYICDSAYANQTANQFKTAMSGVYLFYELAEPVVDTTSTFTENIVVDDFGTMDFVSTLTEPIAPQGNQFFYPADYVLLLDDLNNYLDDNDIGVSGLALKKELLPKLPSTSEDGTYTLKATKSGTTITYAWVKDE